MSIREITAADIPALFDVRPRTRENALSLEELRSLGITPDSVKEWLEQSTKGWLWEEPDRQIVGFCMADGSTGELLVIALLPEHEGRGVGGQLMERAERFLAVSGVTTAWLTTDVDMSLRAYGFYRRRGWRDWKIERGMRWMELTLAPPRTGQGKSATASDA